MTTTATRPAPPNHDKLTCYTDYRCRLPGCVDRYNAYSRERVAARKAGNYAALMDAAPVRRHIQQLMSAGMAADAIAAAADVSVQSIIDFTQPQRIKGRGRRQRTTPTTAAQILAVTPDRRISGRIESVGTIRRVQALVAAGWPIAHIARHAGVKPWSLYDLSRYSTHFISTVRAIDALYDDLRGKRPVNNGVTADSARRARDRASAHRWPPPRYWDQYPGAIDDPHFESMYGKTRAELLAEDTEYLTTVGGVTFERAAERLGLKPDSLERAIHRSRKRTAVTA